MQQNCSLGDVTYTTALLFVSLQNNRLLQDACKEGVDPTIVELLLSEFPGCDMNGRDKVKIFYAVSAM